MMLNTDWTVNGCHKPVKVCTPIIDFETEVVEREPKILTVLDRAVLEPDAILHIEVVGPEKVRIHGTDRGIVNVRRADGTCQELTFEFGGMPFAEFDI